jgi:endonuclease YncB( thermonuclease family)
MRRIVTVFSVLFCTAPALAVTLDAIDGSSFTYNGETFRIANIDAPRIATGECDAERRLGMVAKARLDALLLTGRINIQRGDPLGGEAKDDNGQSLGTVVINGKDIGTLLVAEHLARPRKRTTASWCKD